MCELRKIGRVFTSKSVGTGPSSYEKRIYRAAVSQRLRNTAMERDPNTLPTISYTSCSSLLYNTLQFSCHSEILIFIELQRI